MDNTLILEKLGIKFVPETHKYYKEDREIVSANGMIDKVLGNVFKQDTLYMRQARDKGTVIHKVISDFIRYNITPDFPMIEFENFIWLSNTNNLTWDLSEQIVYANIEGMEYCGTLDLYASCREEISDIKTGSTKQLKKWQIQLSLYAQALQQTFGLKVSRGSILWLHEEKCEYIPITLLSKEEIVAFLKRYYSDDTNIQAEEMSLQCLNSNAIQELDETLTAIEVMENKVKVTKEKILQEMKERNITQIKLGKRIISYVAPTTRESVDIKKLRDNYPKIWNECKRESKVGASIRIK